MTRGLAVVWGCFGAACALMALQGCPPGPGSPDGAPPPSEGAPPPAPQMPEAAPPAAASRVLVANRTSLPTLVYVSFGAGSQVTAKDWAKFCAAVPSGCSFALAASESMDLPLSGKYLNATFAFGAPPACNVSVGEVDVGNPAWSQDTANISLVNGWNKNIEIDVTTGQRLGPTRGATSNAGVYGVFPLGCDICVARQAPPCGIKPCGSSPNDGGQACGCKSGDQYNPAVPCQESFVRGALVTVVLVP